MTRPIYEPSLPRTDAVLGYGSDQLFRRPAPQGGEGEVPWLYINWIDGATIATATTTNLSSLTTFDEGYVSDPALLSVNLADAKLILDPVEGPGTATLPGVWLAHLMVMWLDNFTGQKYAAINWTMNELETVGSLAVDSAGVPSGFVSGDTVLCTSMVVVVAGSGNNWITGSLRQDSGVDQDLSQVVLKAVRIADYPATNGQFYP